MFGRRFRRTHYRRKPFFFPFWIFFAIFFFGFLGKSGMWGILFPLFLVWMFGPMLWGLASAFRGEDEARDWRKQDAQIPPQWQTPPQPASREPVAPAKVSTVGLRSTEGLPVTCSACGGPVNTTTLEWRGQNTPHCGYCGTKLR